jgi:hypothetical protein
MLIIAFTLNTGIFESFLSRGYLVGGILQGLSFPDWKKIIIQKD